MYLVHFANFAYTKVFPTKEKAVRYMEIAGLETTLTDRHGWLIGDYDPISGVYQDSCLTTMYQFECDGK
jgi:hypothetical protein